MSEKAKKYKIYFFHAGKNYRYHANPYPKELAATLQYLSGRYPGHTRFVVYDWKGEQVM